jgi:hypothetical protein
MCQISSVDLFDEFLYFEASDFEIRHYNKIKCRLG